MAPRVNAAAGRSSSHCARARNAIAYTCGVRISPELSRTCARNILIFKMFFLLPFVWWNKVVYYDISGYAGASLPQQEVIWPTLISWSRRLCSWSGAQCHGASLITASDNGNAVCIVYRGSELNSKWQSHWTHRFINCLYCKLLLLQTLFWNIFGAGLQDNFLCKLSAWIRRVRWRHIAFYAYDKIIDTMPLVASFV